MKKLLCLATVLALTVGTLMAAEGPVRHVVSFKFKEGADPEKVRAVEQSFAALKGKIAEIQQLEWGTNVSPENHAKGFTHVWVLTFKDAKDRDAYLIHPDHKAFGAGLKDVIADVFVVDFVPKE